MKEDVIENMISIFTDNYC